MGIFQITIGIIISMMVLAFTIFRIISLFTQRKLPEIKENAPIVYNHISKHLGLLPVGRLISTSKPIENRVKIDYVGSGFKGGKLETVYADLDLIKIISPKNPEFELPIIKILPPDIKYLDDSSDEEETINAKEIIARRTGKIIKDFRHDGMSAIEEELSQMDGGIITQKREENTKLLLESLKEQQAIANFPSPTKEHHKKSK